MKLLDADNIIEGIASELTKDLRKRFPDFPAGEPVEYSEERIQEVDRACRALAANAGVPPSISASALFLCLARVDEARKVVEFAIHPGLDIPLNHKVHQVEIEKRLFLEWLLVDYWRMVGQYRALLQK
jgi:hypothetical protein